MFTRKGRRGRRSRRLLSRETDFVGELLSKRRRYWVTEAIEAKDILYEYLLFGGREVLFRNVAYSPSNAAGEVVAERSVGEREGPHRRAYRRILVITIGSYSVKYVRREIY